MNTIMFAKIGDLNMWRAKQYSSKKNVRPKKYPPFDRVKNIVSEITSVPIERMENCTRKKEVLRARQYYCLFIKKIDPEVTLDSIGQTLGDKDHATILNCLNKASGYFETNDPFFMKHYHSIKEKLGLTN